MTGQRTPRGQKSGTYEAMQLVLLLSALVGLVIGLLHLVALLLVDSSLTRLGDVLTNLTVGALVLNCWRMLRAGRSAVILFFFGALLISLIWGFVSGRGFNFIAAGFGAVILLQLVLFRRSGELA